MHVVENLNLYLCFIYSDHTLKLSPTLAYSRELDLGGSYNPPHPNPILSPPFSPQPAKQTSHQCMSQSPTPSSACLTPCLAVLQGPHLSALNSIETYSSPWMWMSMHSWPAKCIQALRYLSPATLTSSFFSPSFTSLCCHYSHFHPSLGTINNAAWTSSSSVYIHKAYEDTQAQAHSLENTHTKGSVLSVSPVWFIDGHCKPPPAFGGHYHAGRHICTHQ